MAKKHPTPELMKELSKTFAKHNWSGQPIGISKKRPEFAGVVAGTEDEGCPPGTRPQWVTYKLPDGSWATKKICV